MRNDTFSVFIYTTGVFYELETRYKKCEDACIELCRNHNISPQVQPLFSLRRYKTSSWVPPNGDLKTDTKYEFRIRYKVPDLATLRQLDKIAYNYFFYQIRHDLINNKIPEIKYPDHKSEIAGLAVADMYKDMIEKNSRIEYLVRNYKLYLPKEMAKKHPIFLKKKIEQNLQLIEHTQHEAEFTRSNTTEDILSNHRKWYQIFAGNRWKLRSLFTKKGFLRHWDAIFSDRQLHENSNISLNGSGESARSQQQKIHRFTEHYVKSTYLEQINKLAPNLLIEEYSGKAPYPEDESHTNQTCPVKIRFTPFNVENPGLNVFYSYANQWKHIAKIEDLYTIVVDGLKIRISLKDQCTEFELTMSDRESLESLVTYITGYYRLVYKWNVNLCDAYKTPSLKHLLEDKCHGPIGGQFSYQKLKEKTKDVGAYIIRQCGKEYDTYFIDMRTRPEQIETFKVTHNETGKWEIHLGETETRQGSNLTEMALLIDCVDSSNQKYRVGPSDYDKADALLLCQSSEHNRPKRIVNDISAVQVSKPQIIDPETELQLYKKSWSNCEDGIMTQMRAEWRVTGNENLEVNLKILKPEYAANYSSKLLKMANQWGKVDSLNVLKLFGLSLDNPVALVMESARLGAYNEFLRKTPKIDTFCLVDSALSIAQAIHYLHDINIVHSRIRCSNVFVSSYTAPKSLRVKLGDQGFREQYTENDKPWIPREHHAMMQNARVDKKADIYAFSTVLWEIFSLGQNPVHYMNARKKLPCPTHCPTCITAIINEGWDADPDRRFTPQAIFSKLIMTRDSIMPNYAEPQENHRGSRMSIVTDETDLTNRENGDTYESSSIDDTASTRSQASNSTNDSSRMYDGYTPNGSNANVSDGNEPLLEDGAGCIQHLQGILELDVGKIRLNMEIGRGHYGIVYKATLEEHHQGRTRDVAVKQLNYYLDKAVIDDFCNEIDIMKSLDHPNIVKYIDFTENYPASIVMEYIKDSSLNFYLKVNSRSLTTQKLLKFSRDIAQGMAYLRKMNIVHRDLAARNVLVSADESLKISDFGLAKKAGEHGYYTINNVQRSIPFKWYAPESMRTIAYTKNVYSFDSDVWSYGVTLFEIFARGQQEPDLVPNNPSLPPEEFLRLLVDENKRLERPIFCPLDIYDKLIYVCWNINPKKRPSFITILETIGELVGVYGEVIG